MSSKFPPIQLSKQDSYAIRRSNVSAFDAACVLTALAPEKSVCGVHYEFTSLTIVLDRGGVPDGDIGCETLRLERIVDEILHDHGLPNMGRGLY